MRSLAGRRVALVCRRPPPATPSIRKLFAQVLGRLPPIACPRRGLGGLVGGDFEWRVLKRGKGGSWPWQCPHPRRQGLQLAQDPLAPDLVLEGNVAHVLQQLLIGPVERMPEGPDQILFPASQLVHANAHFLDLLDESRRHLLVTFPINRALADESLTKSIREQCGGVEADEQRPGATLNRFADSGMLRNIVLVRTLVAPLIRPPRRRGPQRSGLVRKQR